MYNFIAKLLTFFIFNKKLRKSIRQKIITFLYGHKIIRQAKKLGKGFICDGKSFINKNTYLGDFVRFNGMQIHGEGKVTIGRNFHSGVECMIITQNHNFDNGTEIPFADNDYIYKEVTIGDFVWLGSRVTILPGTKIGEGAIIQGGAVVHGEIPPYAIVGGNPAKVFKYRNIEHFEKLKSEGKYEQ